VRVRVAEGERIAEERGLDVGEAIGHAADDVSQRDFLPVTAEARGDDDAPSLNIARADLDPHRDALELPFGELVARPMLIAIVEADAHAGRREIGAKAFGDAEDGLPLFVGSVDRDDGDLDRSDGGRQAKSGVVAVGHDRGAHHPRAEAP
jgi:hypothetical protein